MSDLLTRLRRKASIFVSKDCKEACEAIEAYQQHEDEIIVALGSKGLLPSEIVSEINRVSAEATNQKTIKEALRFALHLAYRDAGMPDNERQAKVASVISGAEAVSGSHIPPDDFSPTKEQIKWAVSKCEKVIYGPLGTPVAYCELQKDHEGPCRINGLSEDEMAKSLTGGNGK